MKFILLLLLVSLTIPPQVALAQSGVFGPANGGYSQPGEGTFVATNAVIVESQLQAVVVIGPLPNPKFEVRDENGDTVFYVDSVGLMFLATLVGTFTNGEAYLCVYNNGTVFSSDTACT